MRLPSRPKGEAFGKDRRVRRYATRVPEVDMSGSATDGAMEAALYTAELDQTSPMRASVSAPRKPDANVMAAVAQLL